VRRSLGDIGTYRPRELAEYLADNVLTLQPPRVQEFLLRTSLLTRLSAPLCDAVMGWHGSQDTLLQLERSGLFLRSLDSELHWFKYHTLFSSCLSEQLRNVSEDSVAEVHHRAAEWYREKGLYEEAIYHAIEVGDYSFATDILDLWSSRLIADGHLTTVERWSDYLPLSEVRKRPSLMIKIAWALIFLRRQQKLRPILEVLEQKAGTGDVCKTTNPDVILSMAAVMWDDLPKAFAIVDRVKIFEYRPEGFAAFELGAAANLTGYRELTAGNFEKARECLALARAFSEQASASLSGGYSVGVAGQNLIVQGQLGVALERFRTGMQEQRPYLDKSFSSASMVACYIRALYEANELDEAEALFGQFHESIADSVLLDFLAVAYIAMARVHDARGRAAKALEVLDEAENIGHTNKWPRLIRVVNWERVRRALLRDEIDRAESIAERIPRDAERATPSDRILFSEDTEGDVIGAIRLALRKGKPDDALRLISDELALAVAQGRVQRQIKLHILEALAQKKKGVDNAAHRCLRRAIQLAEPGRFIRSFIDEGDEVVALLAEEHQSLARGSKVQPTPQELTGFLHALLQAAGLDPGKSAESGDAQPLEPLTDRERQILIFLANGVSNKEMASRIFLSENTVKFHLKNIYSKLAVSSRLQAINAARQMGII
jgi:LuxR family maltose regulon positive regulatory protein